ncbi:S1C family serine protease [Allobranchiibius sp. CTAmp26]|uniref:S1C family serine protease n=1 Tax=Allobranchiibius sp. CTAmp26 TaxID=2815214 RepID=UPI001AA11050|nr:trypsin-like peptidase domain-containing protein [Allobranchiibius sp. CTAmp26]MBO1755545.1 trypsin-like peptidase domain-containing protein [Allobranchiibius sp. CTAmp26]
MGVVDIDTVLGYQNESGAGTGMVLTSTGEVLTNNHVINGATSIKVTVVSTGVSYTATVVGTDPTQDVAVLQLQGASGLATVKTDSASVGTTDQVVGVGNAGGAGGTPSASTGKITATNATITASDEDGSSAETLHGLIQIDADIQPGDSGGPLYDTTGRVVGIDTADQVTTVGSTTKGYAIPIGSALRIATQIESGTTSSTIHQGYPAFLGISLSSNPTDSTTGAMVEQVLPNTSAIAAGLASGDVITAIDSHQITGPTSLQSTLATYRPGKRIQLTWTDQEGQAQSATVVLTAGPAN